MKNDKIMVTGSGGFIGSNLVKELKKQMAHIVSVDKTTGVDILNKEAIYSAMADVKYLFHMAVLPYNPCSQNPRECAGVNVIGTLNVIEAACETQVTKVIYSSASAVYGNSNFIVDESHPFNVSSLYGASKLMGELIVRNLCEKHGIDYIILRYTNVYGPGQKNGLVPTMVNAIKSGVPPTIYGDGMQSFDFVHVSDVVRANILAVESRVKNEAFNIGGENEKTIKEVIDTILEAMHSSLVPIYKTDEIVLSKRRVASSRKARGILGYSPKIEFKRGIKELV